MFLPIPTSRTGYIRPSSIEVLSSASISSTSILSRDRCRISYRIQCPYVGGRVNIGYVRSKATDFSEAAEVVNLYKIVDDVQMKDFLHIIREDYME